MAKKPNGTKRNPWTKTHDRELKGHSRAKTAVAKISKVMKRQWVRFGREPGNLVLRSAIAGN